MTYNTLKEIGTHIMDRPTRETAPTWDDFDADDTVPVLVRGETVIIGTVHEYRKALTGVDQLWSIDR